MRGHGNGYKTHTVLAKQQQKKVVYVKRHDENNASVQLLWLPASILASQSSDLEHLSHVTRTSSSLPISIHLDHIINYCNTYMLLYTNAYSHTYTNT